MPLTQLILLPVGNFEVTIADFALITCFLIVITNLKIYVEYRYFIWIVILFIMSLFFSIVHVINYAKFAIAFLPFIYALMIIIVTFHIFTINEHQKITKYLFWTIYSILMVSFAPIYYLLISGNNLIKVWFFSREIWRYQFLSQNPNQYAVFVTIMLMILFMIFVKSSKGRIFPLLILMLFSVLPVISSGSRTGTFATFILIGLFLLHSLIKSSFKVKFGVISLLCLLGLLGMFLSKSFASLGGSFERSINIFSMLWSGEISPDNMGASGKTMSEGLFYFSKSPFLGIGLNNFQEYSKYEIHNSFISILAETGIVGFSMFLVLLFTLSHAIIKSGGPLITKVVFGIIFLLFLIMNYPHYLLRQRWVWFFLVVLISISSFRNEYPKNYRHTIVGIN
jgi:O-antigen ligase